VRTSLQQSIDLQQHDWKVRLRAPAHARTAHLRICVHARSRTGIRAFTHLHARCHAHAHTCTYTKHALTCASSHLRS
jgi:hypothetical protein